MKAPAKLILYQGRSFKSYRGMGSLGAMAQGSSERYFQSTEADSLLPSLHRTANRTVWQNWCPKASKAASPTAAPYR